MVVKSMRTLFEKRWKEIYKNLFKNKKNKNIKKFISIEMIL
jgi:hypothetical protein